MTFDREIISKLFKLSERSAARDRVVAVIQDTGIFISCMDDFYFSASNRIRF